MKAHDRVRDDAGDADVAAVEIGKASGRETKGTSNPPKTTIHSPSSPRLMTITKTTMKLRQFAEDAVDHVGVTATMTIGVTGRKVVSENGHGHAMMKTRHDLEGPATGTEIGMRVLTTKRRFADARASQLGWKRSSCWSTQTSRITRNRRAGRADVEAGAARRLAATRR